MVGMLAMTLATNTSRQCLPAGHSRPAPVLRPGGRFLPLRHAGALPVSESPAAPYGPRKHQPEKTAMRIVITGNGDEWDDADHCLHDAMLAAGADAEVYDQEPDGNCYTYLTLPDAA